MLKIKNPRLEIVDDKVYKLKGFKLTGYLNAYEFYCNSEEERNEWVRKLRRVCVSSDVCKHYAFCGLLGEGSFSYVYKGINTEDHKEYAIKRVEKRQVNKNITPLLSLEEEIKVMRMLDHPNILKLYEVYEDELYVYMVEELLKGGELSQEIKNKGIYSEKETAIIMKRLLEILSYCHERRVMHLDLKLENLILM